VTIFPNTQALEKLSDLKKIVRRVAYLKKIASHYIRPALMRVTTHPQYNFFADLKKIVRRVAYLKKLLRPGLTKKIIDV